MYLYKYITNCIKLFSIVIYFKMQFIPVLEKIIFQQPLLHSSVSHDPSEIILILVLLNKYLL